MSGADCLLPELGWGGVGWGPHFFCACKSNRRGRLTGEQRLWDLSHHLMYEVPMLSLVILPK